MIARPEGAQLSLATRASILMSYAEGFQRPRFMLAGPSQEILLSDSAEKWRRLGASGQRPRLQRAKQRRKFSKGWTGLSGWPYGKTISMWPKPPLLKRYKYDAKAMQVDGKGQELVSLKDFSKGHWTRSILFDAREKKMYLTVGSASNVDAGEDPMRAAIHRYNPDGSGHEVVATGVRNVIGLALVSGHAGTLGGRAGARRIGR